VAIRGAGLPAWITISRNLLAGLPETERQTKTPGTSRRVYRPQRAP
jgi:hypothetical protein